jgi:hypothetical protein
MRARWEVAADKGAGYAKWNRILSEEGKHDSPLQGRV